MPYSIAFFAIEPDAGLYLQWVEPALAPELFPVPHAGSRLHRQLESQLVGQHAHLSAMMRLVRQHVGQHRRAGAPGFRPAVAQKLGNPSSAGIDEHLGTAQSAGG